MAATVALVALTVVAYLPVFQAGFVWDDDDYVTANHTLRSLDGLRRIWFEPGAVAQYYPLTFTSLWIDHHLWGASPLGYHVVNVALQAFDAVLVWRILGHLSLAAAWLAAAIFAVHPVHVESVAWVAERKNVLATAFYLSALLAYLGFVSAAPGPRRWRQYAIAVALFTAALLSKTVTCTLPAAILVILWWQHGRVGRREVAPLLPLFALGAGLALVTVWLERHHVGATGADWQLSLLDRVLVAGRVLWFYAGKLVWPSPLMFVYPRWEIDARQWWQWIFPLSAIALVAGLYLARGRFGRGPLAAVLFFAVTLAPALGFVNVFPMRYSFVADHFQYPASLGLIALGAALMAGAFRHASAPAARVATAGLLVLLSGLTARQAAVYRDVETLWRDTLAKNPGCWMAHNNLGLLLVDRGQVDDAMAHYQAALAAKPDDAFAHNNLGNALASRERYPEAMAHYAEALRLDPGHAEAHNNLGNSLAALGRLTEAAEEYAAAVRAKPNYPEAHSNLGNVLAAQGRLDEAEEHYREALRLDPDYADAHHNFASVLAARGHLEEAVAHYRAALRARPTSAGARHDLALALERQGDHVAEAIAAEREAIRLQPNLWTAVAHLAWLLATTSDPGLRRPAEAVALAERAQALGGQGEPVVLDALAASYAAAGRFEDAVETAARAQDLARTAGREELARSIAERAGRYRAGQPFQVP